MRRAIFKILRSSGLPYLFRELVQRNKVTIVILHDISVEAARQAFRFWKEHYNPVSFRDYLDARNNTKKLPPKSLIVTFDDGHKNNYSLLPLINEFEIPVTFFLCSGIVGTNRHFWFLEDSLETDELKKLPDGERISLQEKNNFFQEKEYHLRQALSDKEIEEMKDSPLIDIQGHTISHPILTQCSDEKAFYEISDSKKTLEKKFDLDVMGFAYPAGYYGNREIEMVKKVGYLYAVTADPGFNTLQTDIYKLKRLSVNDSGNIDEIIVKSSGMWGMVKKFFR